MAASEFLLQGPDDFVRLDRRCADLLGEFRDWLQTPAGGREDPQAAVGMAHAADRFLRDFVVDIMETGPGDQDPALVRQYVGNWYIIHTLVPTHDEIDHILTTLGRLYVFLRRQEIVTDDVVRAVTGSVAQRGFFHQRLEAFWALQPDTVAGWRAADDYRRRRVAG